LSRRRSSGLSRDFGPEQRGADCWTMMPSFLTRTRLQRKLVPPSFAIGYPLAVLCHNKPLGLRCQSKQSRKRREHDDHHLTFEQRERRKRRLHPASKWKRILSQCDFWFSNQNLIQDEFLKGEIKKNDGWCRIETLLKFNKLKHWATAQIMVDAFQNAKRFQCKHADENDPRKALVRKRGVTLDHLEILEANSELYSNEENGDNVDENAKRKQTRLPKYRTSKKIVVVRDPDQLLVLCEEIRQSIEKSVSDYNSREASVLGLDVEFATLDLDIRPTLPAMMQLSAPEGPIGLIWLDKFPEHGRSILRDTIYAPLTSLLADPNICKVGASIHTDAKHLAAWWGISDKDYVHHFFSNLHDLNEIPLLLDCLPTGGDQKAGLVEACAAVLKKDLWKKKTSKTNKNKSHWRAPELTNDMKQYAANDASVAVDVWMALKIYREQSNTNNYNDGGGGVATNA
jgi:hypothetical protein